jgi:hypothetical protein
MFRLPVEPALISICVESILGDNYRKGLDDYLDSPLFTADNKSKKSKKH